MLYKLSSKLAKKMVRYSENGEEDVYIYGLELILSTMMIVISILLISHGLSAGNKGFLFIAAFAPLRVFTGGYHAKTYGKCFVISNSLFLLVLFLEYLMRDHVPLALWLALLLLASYYIARSAPVIHEDQPADEDKRAQSKQAAIRILQADIAMILFLAISDKNLIYVPILSICLAAGLMLIADKSF